MEHNHSSSDAHIIELFNLQLWTLSFFIADLLHLDEPDLHGDHPLRPPHRAKLPHAAKSGAAEQVPL